MGAAMAPAAMDTLLRHFQDTNTTPADYDLILTGDLARYGSKLFRELVGRAGVTLGGKHMDAGAAMYSDEQLPGAGASGSVTSAAALLGYVLKEMAQGRLRRVLALATGCLHNALTANQADSCPGVCPGVVLENARRPRRQRRDARILSWASVLGGVFRAAVQRIGRKLPRLSPARLLAGLTVPGAVLSGFGLSAGLVEFAGAGALLPVSGVGASITRG